MGVVGHDDATEENGHDACKTRCHVINTCVHNTSITNSTVQNNVYMIRFLFYNTYTSHDCRN